VRSSGTRARLHLAVASVLCVLLLAACTKNSSGNASASSSSSSSSSGGGSTGATPAACSLLTKAEVGQVTGASIAFSRQASLGSSGSTCTYGSLSGFGVVLSVTTNPAAGLSSDIPGLGNVVSKYNLTPVSGIGDQAYAGADAIVASKGNTAFAIVYGAFGGGNHEQVLKTMATDVVSHL
jgi:hypothetical protein